MKVFQLKYHRSSFGDAALIMLKNNKLYCYIAPSIMTDIDGEVKNSPIHIHKPSQMAWLKFYKGIQKINSPRWKLEYKPPFHIDDGTQWEFSIRIGSINHTVYGNNAFPGDEYDDQNNYGTEDPYNELIIILNELIDYDLLPL